jgi:hypothetical protein
MYAIRLRDLGAESSPESGNSGTEKCFSRTARLPGYANTRRQSGGAC